MLSGIVILQSRGARQSRPAFGLLCDIGGPPARLHHSASFARNPKRASGCRLLGRGRQSASRQSRGRAIDSSDRLVRHGEDLELSRIATLGSSAAIAFGPDATPVMLRGAGPAHRASTLAEFGQYRLCMADQAADSTETITQDGPLLSRGVERRVAVLVVVGPAGEDGGLSPAERLIPFENSVEIGRAPKAARDIATCCLADLRVSGRHASVARARRDGFRVTDLGSKNGTLVEGRPISGSASVGDGALLNVGGHALVLRLLSPESLAAIREDLASPLGPVPTLSAAMASPIRRLRCLAATDEPILLAGETGVGKEVYARAAHRASGRRGELVVVSCAAMSSEQLEAELFGPPRGAREQEAARKGRLLARAQVGTLFFDRIDEMPAAAQGRLLRFLEERRHLPPEGGEGRAANARVMGATSDLGRDPRPGGLRRDLLARFGAEPVVLPPLRRRREDLGLLVRHFLGQPRRLASPAFLALCLHDWPQNVRELEKVMGEAALLSDGKGEIRLADLPAPLQERMAGGGQDADRPPRRDRPDKAALEALLKCHQGNLARVARELGRQWGVVWRWVQHDGIDVEKYRK
jgi:DNA-binding NtrC family response regulator